jgi:hypothetical protein
MIPKLCVTETWLNDSFCNHNLFPDNYFVFHADRVYTDSDITRGGDILTAVHHSFSGCRRKYDLELASEIPILGGFNLHVGNHYFPPNTDVKVIESCFNSVETNLNPQKFHVVLLGDFNVLGYDWVNGFPQANSHYYTKLRGDVIHSTTCYLGLSQCNLTIQNENLLDLVFANISNINVYNFNFSLVNLIFFILYLLLISVYIYLPIHISLFIL